MEGTTWGARRAPPARLAARTAIAARPDPCCRLGGGWWLVAGTGCHMVEKEPAGAITRKGMNRARRSGGFAPWRAWGYQG
jgi:hypothetical protein